MAESTLVQSDSFDSDSKSGVRAFSPLTRVQNINELPTEIFDRLLRLLDQKSLRQTRLVCTKWNDCALQILSKTPGRVELCSQYRIGINPKGLEEIKKLQSILPLTEYPEMFFTELIVGSTVPVVGDIQLLLNLLQEFGSTLKSLELKCITLALPSLRQILENWCPNLEELDISGLVSVAADDNTSIQDLEASSLKLKLRKFKVFDKNGPPVVLNFFISILNCSPELYVLHVRIHNGQLNFWKKLQSLPNITKNLEEVKIETYEGGIANLRDVSFSNKLTSLILYHHYIGGQFPQEQLIGLENVGESLEKLDLFLNARLDRTIEFPMMKRLKVLKFFSYSELFFDSLSYLKTFPNLETLHLPHANLSRRSDFLDASYFPMPYKTLNTLVIKGLSELIPETVIAINRMFPNLRDLTLGVFTFTGETPESTKKSWFIRIFTRLSEMTNLKILHLLIYEVYTRCTYDGVNFDAGFTPLEASESLEELKITSYLCDSPHPPNFLSSLEKVFLRMSKLKVLTTSNFNVSKSRTTPDSINKLLKIWDQNGILVKVEKEFS